MAGRPAWVDARRAAIENGDEVVDADRWVPLEDIFDLDRVPPDCAVVLRRAVAKMVAADLVSPTAKWQAIEFWAVDWMNSTEEGFGKP